MNPSRPSLYLITPDGWNTTDLCATTAQLLATGQIGTLQYRNKSASAPLRLEQATALKHLTQQYGVPLFINDHVTLAQAIGAEGVHIGIDDGDPLAVRPPLKLGISGYNQASRLTEALAAQADYVAFGAIYASTTKPHAVTDRLSHYCDLIQTAKVQGLRTVAIGGLTPANIAPLVTAGVDALAVISAIYAAADPVQAVHDFYAAIVAAQR